MVAVDQALCTGCGICIEACSDIFAWGPDGKAQVVKQSSEECDVEDIAAQCPVEAIEV